MVKQAHNPSTWEMEDNRFKTIFSYKQIQSQTDDDERRQRVVQHFGYRDLRVLCQKVEMSLVLLWSEARNAKGTVALGQVSCYLSSSFTNPLAICEDVTKMKYMDISWGGPIILISSSSMLQPSKALLTH